MRRRTGILLGVLGVAGGLARVAADVHHLQDIVAAVVIAGLAAGLGAPVARRVTAAILAGTASRPSRTTRRTLAG